jgi:hypothetical protein
MPRPLIVHFEPTLYTPSTTKAMDLLITYLFFRSALEELVIYFPGIDPALLA